MGLALVAAVQLVPLVNIPVAGGLADLWVEDTLAFVMAPWGATPYVHIYSVADPANPVHLAAVTDPRLQNPWDLKAEGNHLYVANQCFGSPCQDSAGVLIWDITDPSSPVLTGWIPLPYGTHNIFVHNGILYTAGEVEIWDVSNPAQPAQLVVLSSVDGALQSYDAHDIAVSGDTLYVAAGTFSQNGIFGTLRMYDVSTPSSPVLAGYSPTLSQGSGSWGHAVWPTESRQFVVQTDEVEEGAVWIWSTQTTPWTLVGSFDLGDPIAHNVQVVGDSLAFVSHYTAGLVVLDISDPTNPVLAARYDTYPQSDAGLYEGAWGVMVRWPFVYVSDMQSGLWIFQVQTVDVAERNDRMGPSFLVEGRHIRLSSRIPQARVGLLDALGRVRWTASLTGGDRVALPLLSPGVYRIMVTSPAGTWTRTLMVP